MIKPEDYNLSPEFQKSCFTKPEDKPTTTARARIPSTACLEGCGGEDE